MQIDSVVATPMPGTQSSAAPHAEASQASASLPPDRVEKREVRSDSGQLYNSDILHSAVGSAHAIEASVAASLGGAERVVTTLGEIGAKAASVGTVAARTAAPIAGETLGAAGLVLTVRSSAGNAREDAPGAAWRQYSNAVTDRTPHQTHTTFPSQRVDVGPNRTAYPAHVRPSKDGTLTTPAETQTRPTHTGHSGTDLHELMKPVGTAVHQPSAMHQATLAKPEKVVTSEHAAHLTPSGKLKNADEAVIDQRKFEDYSLNPDHSSGGHKARVFKATLGYDRSNFGGLVAQLKAGVKVRQAVPGEVDKHGARFAVDVPVVGPNGSAVVRTGWIYDDGSEVPRLTTALVKK